MEFAFFTHMSSAPKSGTGEQDSDVTLEDLAKWRFYQEVVTVVELLTDKKEDAYSKYIEELCLSGNMDAIAFSGNFNNF